MLPSATLGPLGTPGVRMILGPVGSAEVPDRSMESASCSVAGARNGSGNGPTCSDEQPASAMVAESDAVASTLAVAPGDGDAALGGAPPGRWVLVMASSLSDSVPYQRHARCPCGQRVLS